MAATTGCAPWHNAVPAAMMLKSLIQHKSPAGHLAPLSVFIFHRVLAEPDALFPLEMHARQFEAVCSWLSRWFNVLHLDHAVTRLQAGTLPERAACLSFDDGYADNFHVALPILQRHGLSATFFIATAFLDGGRMWNDTIVETVRRCTTPLLDLTALGLGRYAVDTPDHRQKAALALISRLKYQPLRTNLAQCMAQLAHVTPPNNLMLTSPEVVALRNSGMQIGAHTMTHPILACLDDAQAQREIVGSKRALEQLLGERVSLFAYPNGKPGEDFKPQHAEMVRRHGFDAGFTTKAGTSKMGDDLFQIRRFTPWETNKYRFGLRLLNNLSQKKSVLARF